MKTWLFPTTRSPLAVIMSSSFFTNIDKSLSGLRTGPQPHWTEVKQLRYTGWYQGSSLSTLYESKFMHKILQLVYIRWHNDRMYSAFTCSEKRKNPSSRSERSSHGLFSSVPSSSSPEAPVLHKTSSHRVVHKGYTNWHGNLIWIYAAAWLPVRRETRDKNMFQITTQPV